MISNLREHDERTLTADGPKFDLEKVLEAGRSILLMLSGRAPMRFPDEPPAMLELSEDVKVGLDEAAIGLLSDIYRDVAKTAYDAADLCVYLSFGPFLVTWAPLGISALYGEFGSCTTIFEEPWEDLDVTPTILIHRRDAPFTQMGRQATKFLAEALKADPYGTEVSFIPNDIDADTVAIRFPHADFGAGQGRIRICRHPHFDVEIEFDGEGDGS